ncbi:DEAD/DEAH box helicase [Alloalcanivorax sp. C16-1]|uniref:DEAD/DEAH box helicase n=1 Tax=Alloalcanivorax sp. C16-1 TaxID=3390051 RepID=UPI00397055B7
MDLSEILEDIHKNGPVSEGILEKVSYYKIFHPDVFVFFEERILSALGLFYKDTNPTNVYSLLMLGFGEQHKRNYGSILTPVQASMRRALEEKRFVSISAPTSAGKSYSARDYIAEIDGNSVVVVPTRALIAEYVKSMKRRFGADKSVMILAHVDEVFKKRSLKRIFVLTPERARELFSKDFSLEVNFFFFDEAQISDEGRRGVYFDALVRRAERKFRNAKMLFAHPFVDNPEAQIEKHDLPKDCSYAKAYMQAAVGRVCVQKHSINKKYYYFSPHSDRGYRVNECKEFSGKFEDFALDGNKSVLVYVSKASIYNGSFLEGFSKYINRFSFVVDDDAKNIISQIASMIGADGSAYKSKMIDLMMRGVVIHHGSIPLEARFLVEDFIRSGFAKLCFATSTLAQGVNMPFDIVWLESMRFLGGGEKFRSLAFKNLIGRAGRLSSSKNFDYGYVYTKNAKLFVEKSRSDFRLSNKSVLDDEFNEDDDVRELVESIKSGTFDDDKNLPLTKVERLSKDNILCDCKEIISIIYSEPTVKGALRGESKKAARDILKKSFSSIFQASLGRRLGEVEESVFMQAMGILLLVFQGWSFKEIVGLRFNRIARRDEAYKGEALFSQPASTLPDASLVHSFSVFPKGTAASEASYDRIVYDTYDYIDKVISYSLCDVFIAAFKVYKEKTNDQRSDKIIELIRYGTNDSMHALMMRYGFPPEYVSEIADYVQFVSEEEIIFKRIVDDAPAYIRNLVDWYLP